MKGHVSVFQGRHKLKLGFLRDEYLLNYFKSRDITLPTKVRLVKAMIFPVVIMGFLGGSEVKVPSWNAGDLGSIPGLG